jgi:hypothetical protein
MRVLAGVLVLVLFPGVAEAADDLAHVVAEGHSLHATASAGNAKDAAQHTDREHGCTALFHVCGCHASASLVASAPLVIDRESTIAETPTCVFETKARGAADGVLGEAFRPPII